MWIKLNATLWPRTQEDKEQVSFFFGLFAFELRAQHTYTFTEIKKRKFINNNKMPFKITVVFSTESTARRNVKANEIANLELSGHNCVD